MYSQISKITLIQRQIKNKEKKLNGNVEITPNVVIYTKWLLVLESLKGEPIPIA